MQRIISSLGSGLVGSLLFFLFNLLFGGDGQSAYTASFYGFWLFAIALFFINKSNKKSDTPSEASINGDTNQIASPNISSHEEPYIESEPKGVGGWLLFLIIGMIFLGPLIGAARTNFDFMTTERHYPNIASLEHWVNYKNITWWIFFAMSALSVYGGVTLARSNDSSAVDQAKGILWFIGPGGVVIDNILAYTLFDEFSFFNLELMKNLIFSLVNPFIWTTYLKKSKRVNNTYKFKDPLDTSSLWEKRQQQGDFKLVHLLLVSILPIALLIYLYSSKEENKGHAISTANPQQTEQTSPVTHNYSQPIFTNPQVQPEFIEIKPPASTNIPLSQEQINYCIAEEIRLDSSLSILDKNNPHQVDHYNALIEDYNKRCINYNYKSGSLDRATSNVVNHRQRLKKEGQDRILQIKNQRPINDSKKSVNSSDLPVVKLSPDVPSKLNIPRNYQVEEVQQILFSKGYYKGLVDGIYGPNTRSAILNFQRDQGLSPDGTVSDVLISQLNRTNQSSSKMAASTSSEAKTNIDVIPNYLQGQNKYPGKPSMAKATPSEQAKIENECASARRDDGRNAYYRCITQQLSALGYQ